MSLSALPLEAGPPRHRDEHASLQSQLINVRCLPSRATMTEMIDNSMHQLDIIPHMIDVATTQFTMLRPDSLLSLVEQVLLERNALDAEFRRQYPSPGWELQRIRKSWPPSVLVRDRSDMREWLVTLFDQHAIWIQDAVDSIHMSGVDGETFVTTRSGREGDDVPAAEALGYAFWANVLTNCLHVFDNQVSVMREDWDFVFHIPQWRCWASIATLEPSASPWWGRLQSARDWISDRPMGRFPSRTWRFRGLTHVDTVLLIALENLLTYYALMGIVYLHVGLNNLLLIGDAIGDDEYRFHYIRQAGTRLNALLPLHTIRAVQFVRTDTMIIEAPMSHVLLVDSSVPVAERGDLMFLVSIGTFLANVDREVANVAPVIHQLALTWRDQVANAWNDADDHGSVVSFIGDWIYRAIRDDAVSRA